MQWPDHFPDDCPPENAEPASGEVYRLVKKKQPKGRDFKSHRENQPHRQFNAPECKVCGVSVYRNIEDICRMKRRVRGAKKRLLAKGTLDPSLGKILQTPSRFGKSHHTWWVPVGAEPSKVFSVIPTPPEC